MIIVLKPFEHDYIDDLITMWRESFEHGVGITDPHPIAEQRQYFLDEVLPKHAVRLAFYLDELVGFVAVTRTSIGQLYVRISHHGRGIGTTLLEWAKTQSDGSLWLYTFARNINASRFYEKHGFVEESRGFEPMWQMEDIRYSWTRHLEQS